MRPTANGPHVDTDIARRYAPPLLAIRVGRAVRGLAGTLLDPDGYKAVIAAAAADRLTAAAADRLTAAAVRIGHLHRRPQELRASLEPAEDAAAVVVATAAADLLGAA